ncbi:MAG: hypothetical protein N2049_09230 [Anaerolineales bacterium]|nr:hypothetical protein [Anaerolineales bacterium]MCX7609382.1 hypothetical protein [Anaerolineales bacterium]MDW8227206.1 hypothetical protein [Anaerolineales bacterium]
MRKEILIGLVWVFILTFVLTACGPRADLAAQTVERYLEALVAADRDQIVALSCAEWEEFAVLEVDSLMAVTARLEQLACTSTPDPAGGFSVTCSGKLIATYGNEDQEIDLSLRTYHVVEQNGEYLMCGYK